MSVQLQREIEHVGVRIAEAVAAEKGCDVLELPPLGEYIDAEALAKVIASGVATEFTWVGCRIRAVGDVVKVETR